MHPTREPIPRRCNGMQIVRGVSAAPAFSPPQLSSSEQTFSSTAIVKGTLLVSARTIKF
jgi:hypothetical protein